MISGFGIAFCCRNLFRAPDSPPCIDFMTFSIIFWRSRFWRQIACWSIHEEVEERNSDCRTAKVCGHCDVMLRLEWCGCLCDTRHASHVTRHTSRITRHTSPITCISSGHLICDGIASICSALGELTVGDALCWMFRVFMFRVLMFRVLIFVVLMFEVLMFRVLMLRVLMFGFGLLAHLLDLRRWRSISFQRSVSNCIRRYLAPRCWKWSVTCCCCCCCCCCCVTPAAPYRVLPEIWRESASCS